MLGKNFNKYWFPINPDKPVSIYINKKRERSRTPPRKRRDVSPDKNEENPKPDRCGIM
jgi:hypothetical protein